MIHLPSPLRRSTAFALGLLCASSVLVSADVKMPSIFSDHMVLQQDTKIPVWGWAEPGEEVTVKLGDKTAKAKAGADGKWKASLPSVVASEKPTELTIKGKNEITIKDVLIGDVWVASGQSNMEFTLGASHNGPATIPNTADEGLRFFKVTRLTKLDPQDDVAHMAGSTGEWQVANPANIAPHSGVAYFFAHDLRLAHKKPIGVIETYWGGTPAQAWTSIEGLKKDAALGGYVDAYEKLKGNQAEIKATFDKENPAYLQAKATYDADMKKLMDQWAIDSKAAKDAGQPIPPNPKTTHPAPKGPASPDGGPNFPTALFNGMVAPVIPYAIKGAIWYQGESNGGQGFEYRTLFSRMITDWREKWGQGDFPFFWVELAGYVGGGPAASQEPVAYAPNDGWTWLREAQLMTLKLPKTGMASAVDIGAGSNIHPTDKEDVGKRLALAARQVAYGEKVVGSGPLYDSMKVEGGKAKLKFKSIGTGLTIGASPWRPNGPAPEPGPELLGFVIAGEDKNFLPAKAKIEGETLVVWADEVAKPVAVRYAWASNPNGNLYNKEKLPASPFRTDDWPSAAGGNGAMPKMEATPAAGAKPADKPAVEKAKDKPAATEKPAAK